MDWSLPSLRRDSLREMVVSKNRFCTENDRHLKHNMKAMELQEQLLIFRVGPIACCVTARDVDSIVNAQALHNLPKQADFIAGVLQYRESTVSIVNLFHKFALETPESPEHGRFIMAYTRHGVTGFWVDEIIEITNDFEQEWSAAPSFIEDKVFDRTLIWHEKLILQTDFDRLFAMQTSAALSQWASKNDDNWDIKKTKSIQSEDTQSQREKITGSPHSETIINDLVTRGTAFSQPVTDTEIELDESTLSQFEHTGQSSFAESVPDFSMAEHNIGLEDVFENDEINSHITEASNEVDEPVTQQNQANIDIPREADSEYLQTDPVEDTASIMVSSSGGEDSVVITESPGSESPLSEASDTLPVSENYEDQVINDSENISDVQGDGSEITETKSNAVVSEPESEIPKTAIVEQDYEDLGKSSTEDSVSLSLKASEFSKTHSFEVLSDVVTEHQDSDFFSQESTTVNVENEDKASTFVLTPGALHDESETTTPQDSSQITQVDEQNEDQFNLTFGSEGEQISTTILKPDSEPTSDVILDSDLRDDFRDSASTLSFPEINAEHLTPAETETGSGLEDTKFSSFDLDIDVTSLETDIDDSLAESLNTLSLEEESVSLDFIDDDSHQTDVKTISSQRTEAQSDLGKELDPGEGLHTSVDVSTELATDSSTEINSSVETNLNIVPETIGHEETTVTATSKTEDFGEDVESYFKQHLDEQISIYQQSVEEQIQKEKLSQPKKYKEQEKNEELEKVEQQEITAQSSSMASEAIEETDVDLTKEVKSFALESVFENSEAIINKDFRGSKTRKITETNNFSTISDIQEGEEAHASVTEFGTSDLESHPSSSDPDSKLESFGESQASGKPGSAAESEIDDSVFEKTHPSKGGEGESEALLVSRNDVSKFERSDHTDEFFQGDEDSREQELKKEEAVRKVLGRIETNSPKKDKNAPFRVIASVLFVATGVFMAGHYGMLPDSFNSSKIRDLVLLHEVFPSLDPKNEKLPLKIETVKEKYGDSVSVAGSVAELPPVKIPVPLVLPEPVVEPGIEQAVDTVKEPVKEAVTKVEENPDVILELKDKSFAESEIETAGPTEIKIQEEKSSDVIAGVPVEASEPTPAVSGSLARSRMLESDPTADTESYVLNIVEPTIDYDVPAKTGGTAKSLPDPKPEKVTKEIVALQSNEIKHESASKLGKINTIEKPPEIDNNSTSIKSANLQTPVFSIHNVVRGDTLWDIAETYLHNPFRYPDLARWSNIKNPDLIYPGNKVKYIPPAKKTSSSSKK